MKVFAHLPSWPGSTCIVNAEAWAECVESTRQRAWPGSGRQGQAPLPVSALTRDQAPPPRVARPRAQTHCANGEAVLAVCPAHTLRCERDTWRPAGEEASEQEERPRGQDAGQGGRQEAGQEWAGRAGGGVAAGGRELVPAQRRVPPTGDD